MVLRADQDFTDLHKTLEFAFDERHSRQVIVLAATGGRLDHDLENLALLARWASRGSLELRDERHRVVPIIDKAELATTAGQPISLMPVGRCERVFTRGLRWELHGEPLDLAGRTSVSNLSEGDRTEIRVEGGALWCSSPTRHALIESPACSSRWRGRRESSRRSTASTSASGSRPCHGPRRGGRLA
jgi:thiamine pyrophosphokinase